MTNNIAKIKKLKSSYDSQRKQYEAVISDIQNGRLFWLVDDKLRCLLEGLESLPPNKRIIQLKILVDYGKEDLVDMGFSREQIKSINEKIVQNIMRIIDRKATLSINEILERSIKAWENEEQAFSKELSKSKIKYNNIKNILRNISNLAAGAGMLICNLVTLQETKSLGSYISIFQSLLLFVAIATL